MRFLALLSLADGIVALSIEIRRRPEIHRKQSLEATREAVLAPPLGPGGGAYVGAQGARRSRHGSHHDCDPIAG
jgi:hypothetical protein